MRSGHWRAECPRKHLGTSAPPVTKTASANAVQHEILELNEDEEESDVFMMTDEPPPMSTQAKASDRVQNLPVGLSGPNSQNSRKNNIRTIRRNPSHKHQMYHDMCNRLKQIIPAHPAMHRFSQKMQRAAPVNPTEDVQGEHNAPQPGDSAQTQVDQQNHPPETSKGTKVINMSNHEECVLFATSSSLGIVDLGASQTVMGQCQLPEFLSSLPKEIRDRIQEKPVNIRFRFGNNSTVSCTRSILVPIAPFWIQIAIVESQTPFLISNSVCRSLGAVIDTERHEIHFKKLQRTIPLSLSSKKLFLLDFCQLVSPEAHSDTLSTVKTENASQAECTSEVLGQDPRVQGNQCGQVTSGKPTMVDNSETT